VNIPSEIVVFAIGVGGFAVLLLDKASSILRGYASTEQGATEGKKAGDRVHELNTQLAVLASEVKATNAKVDLLLSRQDTHQGNHTTEISELTQRVAKLEARVK
jgi:outer membrane murein-binding lipoprotein Lpp